MQHQNPFQRRQLGPPPQLGGEGRLVADHQHLHRQWHVRPAAGEAHHPQQPNRDRELLALAVRAGLDRSFIGIETPNEDALREVMKRQNMRIDLAAELHTVVRAGLMPVCGMIVGFDHDGPVVQIGPLVAPQATPLYARMRAEGRLIEEVFPGGGNLAVTNIRPLRMNLEELQTGLQWPLNRVFDPDAWGARLEHFADLAPPCPHPRKLKVFNVLETRLVRWLAQKGPGDRRVVERLTSLFRRRHHFSNGLRALVLPDAPAMLRA